LLVSQLLDLHLARSIQRWKANDMADVPMSKLRQAAQMVAERRKRMDDRAQALIDAMPKFDTRMNQAFEAHESALAAGEADFEAMLDELKDMEGSNSKNSEGSDDLSEQSKGGVNGER
jgi:hypothetical protein